MIYLLSMVNIIGADDPAMEGARASAWVALALLT